MNEILHKNAIAAVFPALMLSFLFAGCVTAPRGTGQADNGIRFMIHAPAASSVAVAGDFNRWSPGRNLLSGPDKNGYWSTTLDLPPGRHEYLFLVDGIIWVPDPASESADDGMGGTNSVIRVEKRIP